MGTSKKKSSFRIDDILQQQSVENHNNNNSYKISNMDNFKSYIEHMNSATSANQSQIHNTVITSTSSENSSVQSTNSTDSPRKPLPMYPQNVLDMQKSNFCFPMPLGMTSFSPAAAYFEHYANAFHKGLLFSCACTSIKLRTILSSKHSLCVHDGYIARII